MPLSLLSSHIFIFILYLSEEQQCGGTIRLSPSPRHDADLEYEEDFEEDKEAVEAGAEYVISSSIMIPHVMTICHVQGRV